ncbi:transposase [Thermodesulfobacteriota bacterium]
MSRPLRIQYPDAWYHVMNRSRRGDVVFTGKKDYDVFIDLLKELAENYNVKIAAYCLMSNHYHLLVQTPLANISRAMRHLNGVYTQRYNKIHHCDGQLFKGRFKSIIVDADSYLLELLRYIHRNPLGAAMTDNINKYTWSSHKAYLSGAKKWDWLHKKYILSLFSKNGTESIRQYKQFVSKDTLAEINQILGKKTLPIVIGSESFVDKIKELFFADKRHEASPKSRYHSPGVEKIIEAVCRSYKVKKGVLFSSRRGHFNEPRNVAIYLVRRLKGGTLKDVGKIFGIEKNSTVSSAVERLKLEIERNKDLNKRIESLKGKLIKSQA